MPESKAQEKLAARPTDVKERTRARKTKEQDGEADIVFHLKALNSVSHLKIDFFFFQTSINLII